METNAQQHAYGEIDSVRLPGFRKSMQPKAKVPTGRTETKVPAPGQLEGVVNVYREVLVATAAHIAAGVQSLGR
jgi:hypothetical protein